MADIAPFPHSYGRITGITFRALLVISIFLTCSFVLDDSRPFTHGIAMPE